uniref:Uncharacterized protein n=1 Tax=Rhizophora mucronata TaxID=61149 RepID=A0A2P2PXE9_RHIMU
MAYFSYLVLIGSMFFSW